MKYFFVGIVLLLTLVACSGSQCGGFFSKCADTRPMCGGIAGLSCPLGYECHAVANYSDAMGRCELLPDDRCERGGIMCPDGLSCVKEDGLPGDEGWCVADEMDFRSHYCVQDSDCVRQKNCCDCGEGVWVNKDYYNESICSTKDYYCKCALQNRVGVCENNRCTSKPA